LGGDTFDNESVRRSLPIRFAGTTAATPHYCRKNGIGPEKISQELQVLLALISTAYRGHGETAVMAP
jgi:hypothetical protein